MGCPTVAQLAKSLQRFNPSTNLFSLISSISIWYAVVSCLLVLGPVYGQVSRNSTPATLQSPTLNILYGNLYGYNLHNQSMQLLQNVACKNEPAFIDYSFQYNSYVVVCNENNQARIRIIPIDLKEKAKLLADRTMLKRIEMPHRSKYAFDWIHGLLYFTEEKLIYVADLKVEESEEMLIYNTNKSCIISGLIVRPEKATLFWMEHFNTEILTDFIEAQQDGKKPVRLFRKQQSNLESLKYDYLSQSYVAMVVQTMNGRTGWMFSEKNIEKQTELFITVPERLVTQVAFYNQTLIYVTVAPTPEDADRIKPAILWWNLEQGPRVDRYDQLQTIDFKPLTFTMMDQDARPSNLNNLCEHNKCHVDETDFCIPSTLETYVCRSDPLKIHQVAGGGFFRSLFRGKRLFLTTGILVLVLILAIIGFMTLSKKKVRFYQIRLKSINRVNSSKLEPKGVGTNEIAE